MLNVVTFFFTNINLDNVFPPDDLWFGSDAVVQPGRPLLIILSVVCKSYIKEIRGSFPIISANGNAALKAAPPLAKTLATASCRSSNTGPRVMNMQDKPIFLKEGWLVPSQCWNIIENGNICFFRKLKCICVCTEISHGGQQWFHCLTNCHNPSGALTKNFKKWNRLSCTKFHDDQSSKYDTITGNKERSGHIWIFMCFPRTLDHVPVCLNNERKMSMHHHKWREQ